ncbi:MAG TPA: cupin domain-containing protein [Gaiellaceae bacterium]|jgi:uncharacterized cupin superfamily protein
MPEHGDNVWNAELEDFGSGVRGRRLRRADSGIVAAVWELDPGASSGPYHLHHGTDEYLIVLRGRPTLRTPDGERELGEGEVVSFPRGRDGAHQLTNRSDEIVRYVMAAHHGTPEVIEYVDEELLIVGSKTPGHNGEPLFARYRIGEAVADDDS